MRIVAGVPTLPSEKLRRVLDDSAQNGTILEMTVQSVGGPSRDITFTVTDPMITTDAHTYPGVTPDGQGVTVIMSSTGNNVNILEK